MGILHHYLSLALFAAGLLFGVQAPNFVDQYEKRIDAHLIEARVQLAGFLAIADRLYDGDMQKLIAQHAESGDAAFNAEHQVLTENFTRLQRFETAKGALNTRFGGKVVQVLFSPEKGVLKETFRSYTAAFPLTTTAIISGLIGALFICLLFEGIAFFLGSIVRGMARGRNRRHGRKIPEQV